MNGDPLCAPLTACEVSDARVLIQRTAYGPGLAAEAGALPFGALTMQGASLRPFVDLQFEVRWVSRGLCYGPVSSVTTLAPSETVAVATRSEHRTSFTDLLQNAAESSGVSTTTRDQTQQSDITTTGPAAFPLPPNLGDGSTMAPGAGGAPAPGPIGMSGGLGQIAGGVGQTIGGVASGLGQTVQGSPGAKSAMELRPMVARGYGSFFCDVVGDVAAVATGGLSVAVGGLVQGVGDLTAQAVGTPAAPGPIVTTTGQTIQEMIDTISRQESQSHLSETSYSTQDTTATSVTRSFSNPYRDRTMQLRFMPVFRRFDVIPALVNARVGLAMMCGTLDFSTANVAVRHLPILRQIITEPTILRMAHFELGVEGPDFRSASGALADHLQANAGVYTRRFLTASVAARNFSPIHGAFGTLLTNNVTGAAGEALDVSTGLSWANSEVRSNAVHVPLSDVATVTGAWHLNPSETQSLTDAIAQINPSVLANFLTGMTQTVYLYAGTHIEAVAGECVLSGIIGDALSVPQDTE